MPVTLDKAYRLIRRDFRAPVTGDNMPVSAKGDRKKLLEICNQLEYKRCAEIGVQRGFYSKNILRIIQGSKLWCVDPWTPYPYRTVTEARQDQYYTETLSRLRPWLDEDRAVIVRKPSLEAVHDFEDDFFDFVYIDGDHIFDEVMRDLIEWHKKVRVGGMIALHDYCPMRRGGVIFAVDAYTRAHSVVPWYQTREALPTAFWIKEKQE